MFGSGSSLLCEKGRVQKQVCRYPHQPLFKVGSTVLKNDDLYYSSNLFEGGGGGGGCLEGTLD
jgi:hypothetical protein